MKAFNGSENIAEELFEAFLNGENYLDIVDKYKDVTYEKANELAKKIFCADRVAMSVIYPNGTVTEAEDDE
jgi:predicted Zn-dependent peptidase